VSISIVLYPVVVQEIVNKIKRILGTKYELEYYDHCEFNCPAGCDALYICELYVVDKYNDLNVAKITWAERIECVCYETLCEPNRRKLSSELVIENWGLPQDRKAKLEKIIAKVNAKLKK